VREQARWRREGGGQIQDARGEIDSRGLHHRDLLLAQRLANDLETARERCISAASSTPMIMRASDPPMNARR
jgi:hypothetical protein